MAVLTYLRCIIESISHPDLIHLVFHYLLAAPDMKKEDIRPSRPSAIARRRKSDDLLTTLSRGLGQPLPDLFNLVDLILTSLRSRNQQTVTATLRLLCVLIRNRHQYDFSVFRTRVLATSEVHQSAQKFDHDTMALFLMTEQLGEFATLRESYTAHLQDAQAGIESHECSPQLLALPNDRARNLTGIRHKESIDANDSLLKTLVDLINGFLANGIETNLALTQVFSSLALCGNLSLDPWLISTSPAASHPDHGSDAEGEVFPTAVADSADPDSNDETSADTLGPTHLSKEFDASRGGAQESSSPVLKALEQLSRQIEVLRQKVQNFDSLFSERKHVFHVGEEIDAAVANDTPRSKRSENSSAKPHSRAIQNPQISSISDRLMSQDSSVQSSRASSPRGRRVDVQKTSAPVPAGRLSHLHIPPSPTSGTPDTRAFSPSPLRKASFSTSPHPRPSPSVGPGDALRQKLKVRLPFARFPPKRRDISGSSETSSLRSESMAPDREDGINETEVSLSQVLTNVVILQEFMLELAAIMQVRASLFGEVKLD